MSCSDKLLRWQYLGLQGALLAGILAPIYLDTVVVGEHFDATAMTRALNERLQGIQPVGSFTHTKVR